MTNPIRETQIFSEIAKLFAESVPTSEEIVIAALQHSSDPDVQIFFLKEAIAERLRSVLSEKSNTDSTEEYVAVKRLLKTWNVDDEFKTSALDAIKKKLVETEWLHFQTRDILTDLIVRFPEEKEFIESLPQSDLVAFKLSSRVGANLTLGTNSSPMRLKNEKISFKEQFIVGDLIGQGGAKNAYQVEQEATKQLFALKELREDQNSEKGRESVYQEALMQASLAHPGVPVVVALEYNPQSDARPKIVEQFVPKGSWQDAIKRKSLEENLHTLHQVANILAFAHREKGVVHLDVKPSNVMLGNYGEIFLVDWGLAQKLKPGLIANNPGTPAYFAPEIVNGKPISAATDVFLLGGVLYKILVGFAPYERATSEIDAFKKACVCDFPPIPDSVQAELRAVAEKALSLDPKDRYADAKEFADALVRYQRRTEVLARRDKADATLASIRNEFAAVAADNALSKREKRLRRAKLATSLVGNVNEYALIRKELVKINANERSQKANVDDAQTIAKFVRSEIDARNYQLRQMLTLGDYSQASAQVEDLRELEDQYFAPQTAVAASETPSETQALLQSLLPEEYQRESRKLLDEYKRAAQKGLAERRLAVALKFVTVALVVIALIEAYQRIKAQNEALAANEQRMRLQAETILNNYSAEADQALRDNVPQGALTLYVRAKQDIQKTKGLSPEISEEITRRADALMKRTAQTALLIQKESTFTPYVNQIAFSTNGAYFVTLDELGHLLLWDVKTLETTEFRQLGGDKSYVLENPMFKSEGAKKPIEAAPFLVINEHGGVRLFGNGNEFPLLMDLFHDEPLKVVVSCRPEIATWAKGEAFLHIPTNLGEIRTFNLATGKNVANVKLFERPVTYINAANNRIVARSYENSETAFFDEIKTYAFDEKGAKDVKELSLDVSKKDRKQIYATCLSPDGTKIAISFLSSAKSYVFDISSGKRVVSFPSDSRSSSIDQYFFWLRDGSVLSICNDGKPRVWNLQGESPTVTRVMENDQTPEILGFRSFNFSPQTEKLLAFGYDHILRFVDVASGKIVAKSAGVLPRKINWLTVTDSIYIPTVDQFVVSSGGPHVLESYDAQTLLSTTEYDVSWDYQMQNASTSLALRPKTNEFIAAFADGKICKYRIGDPKPIKTVEKALDRVSYGVTFDGNYMFDNLPIIASSADGNLFAGTTMLGNEIILWDADLNVVKRLSKERKDEWNGSHTSTISLNFTDDDRLLETSSNMIQEWNLTTGKIERIKTLAKSSYKIGKALSATPALSNDRKILAIGFQDGEYRLLDVSTPEKAAVDPNYKKEIEEIYSGRLPDLRTRFKIGEESSFLQNSSTENSSVHNLAWSEDDNMLAVTSTAGVSSILLVQREGGFSFSNLTSFVAGVSPSHQSSTNQLGCQLFFTRNKQLVGITTDGALRLWDFTPNDDFDANLTRNQGADVARTSKDGRTLLILRYDGDKAGLRAYIDKEEEEKWFIPGIKDFQSWRDANHEKELCLALDENGEFIALTLSGERVKTPYDFTRGFPKQGFKSFTLSPNGRVVAAVADNSKNVFLFNFDDPTPQWKPIYQPSDNAFVYQIDFSFDSTVLALETSLWEVSEIKFWDLQNERFQTPQGGETITAGMNTGNLHGGKLRFINERFAAYAGFGDMVAIVDVQSRSIFQKFLTPSIPSLADDAYAIEGLASLNRGRYREKPATFVLGGPDGILRFYQYVEKRKTFENVWNISWLKLERIVSFQQNNSKTIDQMRSEKEALLRKIEELEKELNTPEFAEDDFNLDDFADEEELKEESTGSTYNFPQINDLFVDENGEYLYVSTFDAVRAYKLDDVWEKIETTDEEWDEKTVERATGLRFRDGSFQTTLHNRLIPVEASGK